MSPVPIFKLNNGVEMPAIGLGCWSGITQEEREAGVAWMVTALQQGYKHFDTAAGYGTEPILAKAIKQAGAKREDLFITTKLGWDQAVDVHGSFAQSLKDLDTDYVDLYLVHWPFTVARGPDGKEAKNADGDFIPLDKPTFNDTWVEMEKILASGKAKAIGISNFSVKNLEKLLTTAKVIPAVNQVEMHPYLAQPELKAFCDSKGIKITAYTPTGYGTVRADPTIGALAEKYKVQPAQVILAWHLKRGVIVVPKSSSAEHQKENLNPPTLSEEDFEAISKLDKGERLCNKANARGLVWAWNYEQLGW
ncbi:NADP-dependent oxidoreductase domain-containing protein [Cristinia sonorae]|uniref:NADP-dependent oxidoreductase domain-containing protein n=1 Tax=Cristinia sonorae TaxID=1940300 RepID=A0A8K0XKN3_9AGAR|nr:NADP-dependent oxidoreductase domain-containing protein [Cristinia sonorae]